MLISLTSVAGWTYFMHSLAYVIPWLNSLCLPSLYSKHTLYAHGMIALYPSLWLKYWDLPFSSASKTISGVHFRDWGIGSTSRLIVYMYVHTILTTIYHIFMIYYSAIEDVISTALKLITTHTSGSNNTLFSEEMCFINRTKNCSELELSRA